MQENKNKYYDIAERIYDLDGEVYECVGSSLGRTFTGDKRTCVNNLVMLMRTKPQGHLLRSELALISNMARTIRKDEDRSRLMKKYDEILKEIAELPASFGIKKTGCGEGFCDRCGGSGNGSDREQISGIRKDDQRASERL